MGSAEWVPAGADVEQPSSARIYDYWLGGAHNFAVDRQVAEQMIAAYPDAPRMAWANRAFLRRAVEYLVGIGIRQILAGNDRTAVIQEDVRNPEHILEHADLRQLMDLTQPVAVLVVALLHFIPDSDDPAGMSARLTAPLASESYRALSHGTHDGRHEEAAGAKAILQRGASRRRCEPMIRWKRSSPDGSWSSRASYGCRNGTPSHLTTSTTINMTGLASTAGWRANPEAHDRARYIVWDREQHPHR